MNIYTTKEISRIIDTTLKFEGIEMQELVERGAKGVVMEIEKRWPGSTPVHVFAGPYENGAYALAVARLLFKKGYKLKVTLFNIGIDPAKDLCRLERDFLISSGFPIQSYTEVTKSFRRPDFEPDALIVDGLFGSELQRTLEAGYVAFIKHINEKNVNVLSIDVPSGMTGDWNAKTSPNNVIKANLTVAFQFPHLAFFLPNMAANVGEWIVVDTGLKTGAVHSNMQKFILIGRQEARQFLPQRRMWSTKDDYGHGIIFAGSYGMLGAAVMAAQGALRAGIGKLTVSTPLCGFQVIQTSVPEALYQYSESQDFLSSIKPRRQYDAMAVGPGIGTNAVTVAALQEFLSEIPSPIILDADALNCIALRPALLNKIPNMSVITPHAREFDRLFGEQDNGDARLLKALEVAKTYNIVIVMKGRYTAVVRPDGMLTFNGSGTPAMATPGSGDVLTGIITAMMAQLKNPVLAAVAGTYIHGLAGEIAEREQGSYGVLASDIAACTGKAIKEIISL